MRKVTMIFVGVVLAIILIYDAVALITDGTSASISQIIIEWSYQYPVMTFFSGFTCGHLFWRVRGNKDLDKVPGTKVE